MFLKYNIVMLQSGSWFYIVLMCAFKFTIYNFENIVLLILR